MSLASFAGGAENHTAATSEGEPLCSRARCLSPGAWVIEWRNPKIHAEDRVKHWLACDEHRRDLSEFLDARGFLVAVEAR